MPGKELLIIWFFIASLILGYNVLVLSNKAGQISGVPSEVMVLEEKLNKLAMLKSKEEQIAKEKKKFINKLFVTAIKIKKSIIKTKQDKKQLNLPVIQGIIESLDANGKTRRMVLINGKGYVQGQNVNGFLVEKITDNGIYLLKYGKRCFVPLPEVKFSIVKE